MIVLSSDFEYFKAAFFFFSEGTRTRTLFFDTCDNCHGLLSDRFAYFVLNELILEERKRKLLNGFNTLANRSTLTYHY